MGAPAAAPRPRPQYAGRPKLRKLPGSARNLKTKPGPRTRPAPGVARKRPSAAPKRRSKPKMNVYRSRSIGVAAGAGAAAIPVVAGRAAVRMRELPDSGLVVRLTRGRAWIGVLGTLLAGIVALNVLSLGLNATAGQVSVQIDALERDNSALRGDIAEKLSAEKVQDAATSLGLAVPAAEDIGYLGYDDSVLSQAAKVLAGEASDAAASVTPPTLGSSSSSSISTSSSSVSSVPSSTTTAPTTSTSTSTSTTSPAPATSSAPAPSSTSTSGGGGGVSAGL